MRFWFSAAVASAVLMAAGPMSAKAARIQHTENGNVYVRVYEVTRSTPTLVPANVLLANVVGGTILSPVRQLTNAVGWATFDVRFSSSAALASVTVCADVPALNLRMNCKSQTVSHPNPFHSMNFQFPYAHRLPGPVKWLP